MVVQSGNGDKYQFGHLDDDKGERMIGQTLKRGDVIGTEGTTGSSTGYHLDFRLLEEDEETKRTNKDVDAFYKRYLESVNARQPEASREGTEHHVRVTHEGLEHVRVSGLARCSAAGGGAFEGLCAGHPQSEKLTWFRLSQHRRQPQKSEPSGIKLSHDNGRVARTTRA